MGVLPEEFRFARIHQRRSQDYAARDQKYPNRRLYDTDTSTYITLSEVRQLVIDNQNVVVRDAKTGEDLTRSILLQIILEEEAGGAPMFSEAVLPTSSVSTAMPCRVSWGVPRKKCAGVHRCAKKLAEQSQSVTPEMWGAVHEPAVAHAQGHDGQLRGAVPVHAHANAGADAKSRPSRCWAHLGSSADRTILHLHPVLSGPMWGANRRPPRGTGTIGG